MIIMIRQPVYDIFKMCSGDIINNVFKILVVIGFVTVTALRIFTFLWNSINGRLYEMK